MFKNLTIFRLPKNWGITAEKIEASLATNAFQPCTSLDHMSSGWVSPRDNGRLVSEVSGQIIIMLGMEKKLLPSSVINQVTKIKSAEIEEQQGFKPGRKQLKELKEQVTDDLLPRAFSVWSAVKVWIDRRNGFLVIDTASPAKSDMVLKHLFKSIDTFPLVSLQVRTSPVSAMTEWLVEDTAPHGFTVDQDTELRATGEGKATVRYVRHTLEAEDVRRHIASGKQSTRLAMTWADKISFVLTENLAIKRVAPLDVIKENAEVLANDDERYESEVTLFTGEFSMMIHDLIDALGGEKEQTDLIVG